MAPFKTTGLLLIGLLGCQVSTPTPAPKVTIVPAVAAQAPAHITLRGRVQPPGPAQIEIENTPYRTTSDAQGNFQIERVPSAAAKSLRAFHIQSDGTELATRRELVPSTATVDLGTLLLAQTGAIVGVISTPTPTDLTGTTVYIAGTSLAARTDAQGNYFIPQVPAGVYTVTVDRPDYGRATGVVQVESGQPAPLHLEIRPETQIGTYLTGQVSGPDGPLAGVRLQLGDRTTLSDVQGQYRIGPLGDGAHTLHAQREGFAAHTQTVQMPSVPVSLTLAPQAALRPGTLGGQVRDAHGAAIAGVTVALEPPVATSVTTDAAGHFQFSELLPGAYYLRAQRQGQLVASGFASLAPGQNVAVPVQGVVSVTGLACLQNNHNQIAVEAPGAQVTVNVTNTNTCTITPQNK